MSFDSTARTLREALVSDIQSLSSRRFLRLDVEAPHEAMLEEARGLVDLFVPHRENPEWKSLVVHGLGASMTLGPTAYGYTNHTAPYRWTEICDRCPVTAEFFRTRWPNDGFNRIRFMLLEPGGGIDWHSDYRRPHLMAATNIALNNPDGCVFSFRDGQTIPFAPGTAFLVNIHHEHRVRNASGERRFHVIVHQKMGSRSFEELVLHSFAAEKRLVVGVLDHPGIESAELADRLTQLAWFDGRQQNRCHVVFGRTVDEILEQTDCYRYCLVNQLGHHWSPQQLAAMPAVGHAMPSDALLMGHILDRPPYVHLHRQTMLVDLERWRALGRPSFDRPRRGRLHRPERSPENVHDDYTPLWLRPSGERTDEIDTEQDGEAISAALDAGLRIVNFSKELRRQKCHAYPEFNHPGFARFFETGDPELLDRYQRRFHEMTNVGRKVFAWNTESLDLPAFAERAFARYAGPASGIKLEYLAARCGLRPGTRVTFFDANPDALCFKRHVYDRFTGGSYREFVTAAAVELKVELDELRLPVHEANDAKFGDREIVETIQRIRETCELEYVSADLIRDPESLVEALGGGECLLWISNVYSFVDTQKQHPVSELRASFDRLLRAIASRPAATVVSGRSPTGVSFLLEDVRPVVEG